MTKISELTAGTAATGIETFPVVQGGTTVKLTLRQAQAPVVTPEMFGAVSGSDCTAAFQALAAWLNANGGGAIVNFAHNADYKIWPVGTHPSIALNLVAVRGVTWNFNGSRISTDNLFGFFDGPAVFAISNSSNLRFNDAEYVETAWSALDASNNAAFFAVAEQVAPWSENIDWTNIKQNGGSKCINFGSAITGSANNFSVINATIKNVYYGFNFQGSGDNFFARGIKCDNVGRAYFPWNVSDHDVEIIGNGGGPFNQCLLKVYAYPNVSAERNSLSNIRLVYKNAGRINATASASLATLAFQQQVAQVNVSGAANNGSGKVRLTVSSTANMASGQTWFFNAIGGTVEANGSFIVTVIDATHVDLATVSFVNVYTSGGYARVPATIKNVKILLDVNDTTGNGQPPALLTYKNNSDASIDTTTNGYTLENVELSGTLKGYGGVNPAVSLFTNDGYSTGTWTGENLRNIFIRDLTAVNSFNFVDATNIQAHLEFKNVYGGLWTLTGAGANTRTQNTVTTGLTDHMTVVPSAAVANQFMTGISATDGSITRAQPSAANLSDGNTGTGAVVHATSPALTTPTGIVKGDVGLGNVDNTSDATKNAAAVALTNKTNVLVSSPSGGIGYSAGAGGTATQATSKSTTVVLNPVTGTITMNAAALAAGTIVSFVLTNSALAATDQIMVSHESGGTLGAYTVNGRATGAGTGAIDIRNNTAGSLSEAIVLRFSIVKSVNA